MPFVPAPQIVRVEVRALYLGQHIENVFDIDALTAVGPGEIDDITNLVSVWAQAEYWPLLPNTCQLTEVVGTDMGDENGGTHTIIPEGTVVGGRSGDPMPNETSFCVSLRTGSRGRSARGRKFVLGILKDDTDANSLIGTLPADFVAAFQTLVTTMTTNGFAWVIVSYIHDNAPRVGGPVYFPVTTCVAVDNLLDSQRRRKPGNGT